MLCVMPLNLTEETVKIKYGCVHVGTRAEFCV